MTVRNPSHARRKERGRQGEQSAASYLMKRGYRIVERNFRSRRGEVDIICTKERTLIFVEVKNWGFYGKEGMEYAIDAAKQRRIIATAKQFLFEYPLYNDHCIRYDVIFLSHGEESIEHLRDAFSEESPFA